LADHRRQSVLNGAIILSAAVIFVKIIGVFYKIPLTDLIGGTGRGYFNSAYELYTPIYAISMAGLPIAVSRLVSENVALRRYREARMIYKVSVRLFLLIGVAGTLLLFIVSKPYTDYVADSRNLPAVLTISPCMFFCCAMSVYRGYYEGLRNMKPTAFSQVIEAFTKLAVGLISAKAVMAYGLRQYEAGSAVFGVQVHNKAEALSAIYPYSAAGAILGVTLGTVLGTLYLVFIFKIKGDGITRTELVNSPKPSSNKMIMKRLITTAIPMVASALILNITNLIDTVTIQTRLRHAISENPEIIKNMYAASLQAAKTLDKDIVKYLWGTYGASLDFKNFIPMIMLSLGVSALPALSAAWATNDKKSAKSTIETVLRVCMLVTLPAGIGIGALAEPILTLIYGRGSSADIIPIAAPMVSIFGYTTALVSVSAPITNMLQAIGRADIPVKSLVVASITKILCNYTIIGMPQYNIKGAPFGSVLFYVIVVSYNLFFLIRVSKVKINAVSTFIKPFACSLLCGITAWSSYGFISGILSGGTVSVTGRNILSLLVSIALAASAYLISIVLIKGITGEDVSVIPKGKKIAKVLEKYGLLG